MLHRHEEPMFNEREWTCVSMQAPLGTVVLARRLPAHTARPSGTVTDWISRRFAPRILTDPAAKRPRARRST
jgi:hypothetical protein